MVDKSKVYFWRYSAFSRGPRLLADPNALGVKVIKFDESKFQGAPNKLVINWGSKETSEEVSKCQVINKPNLVSVNSDKLEFFKRMKQNEGVRIPEFTTDKETAFAWVAEGKEVLGRTLLNSSGGKGIVFMDDIQKFSSSKLWTVYKKKKEEYRVHIVRGSIILVQKKVLRQTDEAGNAIVKDNIDFRIRNHANGFIFQRENLNPPADVITQAQRAFTVTGLDFGAFDIIYNEHEDQAYVLEVNTAPGIEGSTVQDYTAAFKEHFSITGY